ncbi:MAG: twin-arginine translocation signal domain-containing protein, partial [Sphingobacterium sp.]
MKNDQTKNLMNRLLDSEVSSHTRRNFLRTLGLGAAALGMNNIGCTNPTSNQQLRAVDSVDLTSIPGFEKVAVDATASEDWT